MSEIITDENETPRNEEKSYNELIDLLLVQNKNERKMLEIKEKYFSRQSVEKKKYQLQLGKVQKQIKEQDKLIDFLKKVDASDFE